MRNEAGYNIICLHSRAQYSHPCLLRCCACRSSMTSISFMAGHWCQQMMGNLSVCSLWASQGQCGMLQHLGILSLLRPAPGLVAGRTFLVLVCCLSPAYRWSQCLSSRSSGNKFLRLGITVEHKNLQVSLEDQTRSSAFQWSFNSLSKHLLRKLDD